MFSPALFEFFGAWRIKKFEQWGKGDQRCYDFCVKDLQDLNDVKGDYVNENDMFDSDSDSEMEEDDDVFGEEKKEEPV